MQKIPKLRAIYPGIEHDQLFVATYPHPGNANTCRECFGETIARRHLEQEIPLPSVHFGRIAFSSMLMRSAEHLDADTGEAEKLFWRLLRVQTKVLGEEHPDTSGTMEKLAWMHLDQGRLDHSEALYQKVLHTRRRTMGVHHPDTAFILNRLGVVYARKEMWEDAEKFYAGHWIPREPCWERGTPTRWRAWNTWRGLGALFSHQGMWEEAAESYKETLAIWRDVMGEVNNVALNTMEDLAWASSGQERVDEAEELCRTVFA